MFIVFGNILQIFEIFSEFYIHSLMLDIIRYGERLDFLHESSSQRIILAKDLMTFAQSLIASYSEQKFRIEIFLVMEGSIHYSSVTL